MMKALERTATPIAATARSTSRSPRCPSTASWRGWITKASSPARASTSDEYDKDDARDFVLWKATKPGEPTWDYGLGPGPSGLAHRVLGDGAAPARRAADRHPRRRHRPDLSASRERDRAERRRHRHAVLAVLGARRAPDSRQREDVEVARQRLHGAATSSSAASARRRCATCCSRRTTASSCAFTWEILQQAEEAVRRLADFLARLDTVKAGEAARRHLGRARRRRAPSSTSARGRPEHLGGAWR